MNKREKLVALIEVAIKNADSRGFLDLGVITAKEIKAVKSATDLDLTDYVRVIEASSIRHVLTKHGNEKKELKQGQAPVVAADFLLIEDICKNPEKITLSKSKSSGNGNSVLIYEKKIFDYYYYFEEIRTGRKKLGMVTLYKKAAK